MKYVKALFTVASKTLPSVIFIDEVWCLCGNYPDAFENE